MDWEKLGEFDEIKAGMIKGLLEENDIPVLIKQSDYAMPVIFGSGGIVEVYVPSGSLRRAKELVDEFIGEEG